jgi:UDP-glucose 4-epimerase
LNAFSGLAKGHVKALQKLENKSQVLTVNLGTGNGYSVLDMVKAFKKKALGKEVPYQIVDRRADDIATCYADPVYAAGRQNVSLMRCVKMLGVGSHKIQMDA